MEISGKDIWIVSSDAQLPILMERLLGGKHHNIKKFTSSGAAIEALSETRPDLIITDIVINGVENAGMTVFKKAKTAGVKTIIQSSGDDISKPMMLEAKKLGAVFIKIPYMDNEHFINTFKNSLAQSIGAERISSNGKFRM